MKKIIITFLLIFHTIIGLTQNKINLQKAEDTLKVLGNLILNGETDFIKYNANEKFIIILEKVLIDDNSFDYPFDSLVTIARLWSEDNKFRIFNWNLRKSDGTYEYFGLIQSWNNIEKKYIIYTLKDNSDNIIKPETQILETNNWYGALYYKIIFNKSGGKKYYTLLGWDGNNNTTKKKIIDVIIFNSKDRPIFGAPIFKYNKKTLKRIIFEYNGTVSMSLKYEKQFMLHGKKKRKMIVFDRISPLDPRMEGIYQYYYPETNIFDALIFRNGKWNLLKDVDARNTNGTKEEKEYRKKILKEQEEHSKH